MDPNSFPPANPPPNPPSYPPAVPPPYQPATPYPPAGPTPYGQSSPYPSASPFPMAPALWNPGAAASWSLLFTPAFGAWLHASNWRTLGQPDKARASMIWVWLSLAVVLGVALLAVVSSSDGMTSLTRIAGIALLLSWYFGSATGQVKYVKEVLGGSYVKRGWGKPLLLGLAALVAYFVLLVVLGIFLTSYNPQSLSEQVKPLILNEWHKKPALKDATIQTVSLTKKGDNFYSGYVDATFTGGPRRLILEVTTRPGGQGIEWEVKEPENK